MQNIAGQIRNFIIDNFLFGNDEQLSDNTSFIEEGIIDSTGVLELVAFIEDNFSFRILDEELIPENLDSIDNITKYIGTKINTASATRQDKQFHRISDIAN